MGFLDKLFGRGDDPANRSDVAAAGKTCARCGEPIPQGELALDSGRGLPIHRFCPEGSEAAEEAKTSLTKPRKDS